MQISKEQYIRSDIWVNIGANVGDNIWNNIWFSIWLSIGDNIVSNINTNNFPIILLTPQTKQNIISQIKESLRHE